MDVKNAIEDVKGSKTLRQVLGTLLSIGNFLNGREVRGLRVETGDQRFAAECMITVLSSVKNYILIAALKLKEE